MLVNSVLQS